MLELNEDKIRRMIKRSEVHLKLLEDREDNLSKWGYESIGYYKGRISILEELLDLIVEASESSVEDAHTADVVEVTRCKYCKFYEPYDKPSEDFDGRCFARNCETDEYDFCSYGVMRKDTTSDAEIH